jgi:uncharacterized protein YuzE
MTIKYFVDTDTLFLGLMEGNVFETKDLDENTLIDFDNNGNLLALTIEHAKRRVDISNFSIQQIPVERSVAA